MAQFNSNRALVIGKGRSGEAAAQQLAAAGYEVDFAEGYAVCVTSPGVSVKSELQFGCELLRHRGWKLLAITGSKGKSSVVKLCAEALGGIPCGNYGRPVASLASETPGWAVVEVSSFQLETTTLAPDTFEAAAILNLQADHLDRHGTLATYHALKEKLLSFAKLAIRPPTPPTIAAARALFAGTYFDNSILAANAACAVALLRAAGLADAAIAAAFRAFRPLPHRFELVTELNGVRFIDDSKATSIAALTAGVEMCDANVRLIAGGLAKGDDPTTATPTLTRKAKKVYIIGDCADALYAAWHELVDCEVCGTLAKAVAKAKCEALKGETVLLSPGCASYDQFKSFEERGETFARLITGK